MINCYTQLWRHSYGLQVDCSKYYSIHMLLFCLVLGCCSRSIAQLVSLDISRVGAYNSHKMKNIWAMDCRYNVRYPDLYASADNKDAKAFNCVQVSFPYSCSSTSCQGMIHWSMLLSRNKNSLDKSMIKPIGSTSNNCTGYCQNLQCSPADLTAQESCIEGSTNMNFFWSIPERSKIVVMPCRGHIRTAWKLSQCISSLPSFWAPRYVCCQINTFSISLGLSGYGKLRQHIISKKYQLCAARFAVQHIYRLSLHV